MTQHDIPIWSDPDVRGICDFGDGQAFPRFGQLNHDEVSSRLLREFVEADQLAGSDGPAEAFIEVCLAGIRAVEWFDGKVDKGWVKFFLYFVGINNSFLWDLYRRAEEAAAIGEWVVVTIERHGWGPDGRTALGQRHGDAMAIAAQAGGGLRHNPQTGRMEYGDGQAARRAALAYGFGQEFNPDGGPMEVSTLEGSSAFERSEPVTMAQDAVAATHYRLEQAAGGDKASEVFLAALLAQDAGDEAGFVARLEEAARLGDGEAILEAGRANANLGNDQVARFWGEVAEAAGFTGAYSLLAQLSEKAGDEVSEREWSRSGAEAGDGWSMANHAYFLLMDAREAIEADSPGSVVNPLLDQCLQYAVRAANLGHVNAMYSAGLASAIMDNRQSALEWLSRAEQNGHPGARQMIEHFKLA